jgi:hypothetical protein
MNFGKIIWLSSLPAVLGATMIALAPSAMADEDEGRGHVPATITITNDIPVVTNAIADRASVIPEPPTGMVALRLTTAYSPDRLPGGGLIFHNADPEVNSLWASEMLEPSEEIPVLEAIENGVIFLKPGEERMVTVVYENPTGETVSFVTLPHQDSPAYLAHFAKLTCFCLSFVYEAPANGSWYRVIRVAVNPDTPTGSKIDAVFTILTNPADFAPAGT